MGRPASRSIVFVVGVLLAPQAVAQNANDVLGLIGGIANLATAHSVRGEWKKLSSDVSLCTERELKELNLSIEALVQNGTRPSDTGLKKLLEYCGEKPSTALDSPPPTQAQFGQVRRPGEGEREIVLRRWSQMSLTDRACVERSMQGGQTTRTINDLIQQGISPSDPSILAVLAECRKIETDKQQAREAQELEIARKAAQIAAETRREIEEWNRKEAADKKAVEDAEKAQLSAFQKAEEERQIRNQYLQIGSCIAALVFLLLAIDWWRKRPSAVSPSQPALSAEPISTSQSTGSDARPPLYTKLVGALVLIPLLTYLAVDSLPFINSQLNPVELSIDLHTLAGGGHSPIGITNLSSKSVRLKEVRVNKRSDESCSAKMDQALGVGENTIVALIPAMMGLCGGPIARITIITDRSEDEFSVTQSRNR